MIVMLKIYGQSVRDKRKYWTIKKKKKYDNKNDSRRLWRVEKKIYIHIFLEIIQLYWNRKELVGGREWGERLKMFIQMSVLNTLHISPLFLAHSFSRYWNTRVHLGVLVLSGWVASAVAELSVPLKLVTQTTPHIYIIITIQFLYRVNASR